MQLLLCAATEFEIEPTLHFIKHHPDLQLKVGVLITGVGLTSATYQLTKKIFTAKPSFILQAGIAGSLHPWLQPGNLVVVEKEQIGDLGVMDKNQFSSLFHLGFVKLNEAPWENGKLCNNVSLLRKTSLKIVDAVTINEITTNQDRIAFYRNELKADIETMEGAALHYVCLMEKIPFLQLRSISNFVGERDKSKWKLKESVAQLNIELQRLLIKLFKK